MLNEKIKVRKSQKQFIFFRLPKTERKYFPISAQASKMVKIKNKTKRNSPLMIILYNVSIWPFSRPNHPESWRNTNMKKDGSLGATYLSILLYQYQTLEILLGNFCCSLFWRIKGTKNCSWNFLTFSIEVDETCQSHKFQLLRISKG